VRGQDAVAQAPAIQERIQCYVIPAIQILYAHAALAAQLASLDGASPSSPPQTGVQVIVVTATVDQAAQAQRLAVGLGGALGLRTALCVGASCGAEQMQSELQALQKQPPHILVGTPHKLVDLFSLRTGGGLSTRDVRLLVVDECDQLIARNLADHVLNLARLLPSTVSVPVPGSGSNGAASANGGASTSPLMMRSPLPGAFDSPFASSPMSRFGSSAGAGSSQGVQAAPPPPTMVTVERQMAILSCTVPQDVLAFAANLQLKEPVKVLVRRDNSGGAGGGDGGSQGGGGGNGMMSGPSGAGGGVGPSSGGGGGSMRGLKQFYLYLAVGGPGHPGFNGGPRRRDGQGPGSASSSLAAAREWKLEALADLCEDHSFEHAVIFASSLDAVEAITYRLGTRAVEAFALHQDMGPQVRSGTVAKFRSTQPNRPGLAVKRVLVVYDALSRGLTDVGQVPLVINFDMPRAVEDYVHRCVPLSLSSPLCAHRARLTLLSTRAASPAPPGTTRAAWCSTSSRPPRSTCSATSRASSASRSSSSRTTLRRRRSSAARLGPLSSTSRPRPRPATSLSLSPFLAHGPPRPSTPSSVYPSPSLVLVLLARPDP